LVLLGAVVSLIAIREELGRERRLKGWSLDDLAERARSNRATIHKLENVRSYPDYVPGLDTLQHVLAAFGLTFTKFFLRLEREPLTLSVADLDRMTMPSPPADLQQRATGLPLPPAPPTPRARGTTPATAAAGRNKRASHRRR
jgi:transcriptional regulator with XRE-family HTH domain